MKKIKADKPPTRGMNNKEWLKTNEPANMDTSIQLATSRSIPSQKLMAFTRKIKKKRSDIERSMDKTGDKEKKIYALEDENSNREEVKNCMINL